MIERGSSATTIGELWEKQGLLLTRPVVYTECLWPLNEVVGRERRKRERSRKGEEGKKEREGEVGEREMKRERAVSYTHLTLPTIHVLCRSRWSPYH